MSEILIYAPKKIGNNYMGANFLANFFYICDNNQGKIIVINFKNTRWLRANLSAVLGAVCYRGKDNNNQIIFKNLTESIKKILRKNHFFKEFGVDEIDDIYHSTIKYKKFLPNERTSFSKYVRDEFIPSLGVSISKSFEQEFRKAIEELFQNCRLHGQCKDIFVCGQYFPTENKIYFTIINLGTTIKENIENKFKNFEITPEKAIVWATKIGNTTRADENIGGIGLDFLIRFLDETDGKIHILSDKASYERENKIENSLALEKKFSGTMVTLIFSLNHVSKYKDDNLEVIDLLEGFF